MPFPGDVPASTDLPAVASWASAWQALPAAAHSLGPAVPASTEEGPAYPGEYNGVTASDARTSAQIIPPGAFIGEAEVSDNHSLIFGDWTDKGVVVHGSLEELGAFVARLAVLVAAGIPPQRVGSQ